MFSGTFFVEWDMYANKQELEDKKTEYNSRYQTPTTIRKLFMQITANLTKDITKLFLVG